MQFSILTFAVLISAVVAGPIGRRQVNVNEASMTDANGAVVPFKSDGVFQANAEAGL
ncbi:hypothetical protein AK830_g10838 [Neonectria ditissima]|uniref:Uncharacterized protein n=1 Tax=Neonectria ditissima TaxID=78410 RepID=A0A0P7B6B3_9HYPO|nr:hypothetical protein AK830_g10838 [Neonectria ditissima]